MKKDFKWQNQQAFTEKFVRDNTENQDVTDESFKSFMNWLHESYCGHFQTDLDQMFADRKKYIISLESELAKQVERVETL